MCYAKNGTAIINGEVVPKTEVDVLHALYSLQKNSTVAEISIKLNGILSDASLYTLLKRLKRKELVDNKKDKLTDIPGRPISRVFWIINEVAIKFFNEHPLLKT